MTEKNFNAVREQLKLAKERRGPAPAGLVEEVKEQARTQKAVLEALDKGPLTVPELAAAAGLSPRKALWWVTALRKYGRVAEGPKRGAYLSYAKNAEKP